MSLRTTFILMWVFLIIGGAVSYDYFWLKAGREKAAEKEKLVVDLEDKKIERIEIKAKESLTLACASPEGCAPDGSAEWLLTAPVQDKGDSSAIGSLASAALNLNYLEKIDFDTPPDPLEFGLGENAKRVQFGIKGGEAITLEVGGATAAGPNVYVLNPKEPLRLYVVASFFAQMLEKDIFHWRNKRLFPQIETESVTELAWKGKSSLRAVKLEGKWQIEQPVKAEANFVMLEGLVSTLVYAAAISIEKDGFQPSGSPALEFSFLSGGEKQTLALYAQSKSKDYLARANGKGPWFVVAPTSFLRFQKPLLEYRDRKIFGSLDRGAIEEIALFFPREKTNVTFWLENGQWITKDKGEWSESRVRSILDALFRTEATAFLPASSQGAKIFASRPADVSVAVKASGQVEEKASFLIVERKSAITGGRVPGEVRAYGEDLLRALPIRLQDLYSANNQVVAPAPEEKEEDGHSNHHHHAH